MNQETRALTLYLLTKNYDNLFMLNNSMLRYIIVRVIIQCIIYIIVRGNQGPGGPRVFFMACLHGLSALNKTQCYYCTLA